MLRPFIVKVSVLGTFPLVNYICINISSLNQLVSIFQWKISICDYLFTAYTLLSLVSSTYIFMN